MMMRGPSRAQYVAFTIMAGFITMAVAELGHGTRDPSATADAPARSFSATRAPAAAASDAILVRMFRGHMGQSSQEVSITTIFREPTFTVLDEASDDDSEELLRQHIKEIFSLAKIASLGSSTVSLAGGSVFLDEGSRVTRIHVTGQAVGSGAVRIVVSQANQGAEMVATSVIARRGRTAVLAGTSEGAARAGDLLFICLTPL